MTHPNEVLNKASLGKPADLGIRLVARSLLAMAEAAGTALHASADSFRDGSDAADESLHDFRVALRRLRSWLRAFEPSLRGAVRRKDQRRLRTIVRATNAARDAAVESTWLGSRDGELETSKRAGYDVMRTRLNKQRAKALDRVLGAVERFDRLAPKLKHRIQDNSEIFGTLVAETIADAASELERSLSRVRDWDDVLREHRARIAAKRLRYVIEPVSQLAEAGEALVESLKSLQDQLGELHDIHVFSSEVSRAARKINEETEPGLTDLSARAESRGQSLFDEIAREWLNGAAAPFFERVRAFVGDLVSAANSDGLDGARGRHIQPTKKVIP